MAKRQWPKLSDPPENKLVQLIWDGIDQFKRIVVRLEQKYGLNLKHMIDFKLLTTVAVAHQNGIDHRKQSDEFYTLSTINYALETVHALLLSLGDLHRYYVDFKFTKPHYHATINRSVAARYYFEAFKLNSKIGMPQNQLGTLYSGQNYDFDSMYYYLYSLVCQQPFELSDNNVSKIFQTNSEYLERANDNVKLDLSIRDFLSQFILIVDIFFYDKDVTDFNMLCHCVLVDFRKILQSKRIELPDNEFLYKFVAVLLFCLAKLKAIDSSKKYSLNAFLVAICSELIDACTTKLEQFVGDRQPQNDKFQLTYGRMFEAFDTNVRQSRNSLRKVDAAATATKILVKVTTSSTDVDENRSVRESVKSKGSTPLAGASSQSQNSAKNDEKLVALNAANRNNGPQRNGDISGGIKVADAKSPAVSLKDRKVVPNKFRRRRRKISLYDTDTDLSSYDDDTDDEEKPGAADSDIEMDSDFSSDDNVSYVSSYESSDDEYGSDGEEPVQNGVAKQEQPPMENVSVVYFLLFCVVFLVFVTVQKCQSIFSFHRVGTKIMNK